VWRGVERCEEYVFHSDLRRDLHALDCMITCIVCKVQSTIAAHAVSDVNIYGQFLA
jgi:hypothetical protein